MAKGETLVKKGNNWAIFRRCMQTCDSCGYIDIKYIECVCKHVYMLVSICFVLLTNKHIYNFDKCWA